MELSDFWENFGFAVPIGSADKKGGIEEDTNLNDGMGAAWAGQSKARGCADISVKANVSVFWENLGFAPPIGSEIWPRKGLIFWTDLNDGTGDPWAGQRRARLESNFFLNEEDSRMEGNLGFADPIGSTRTHVAEIRQINYYT